jgi:exopolyphosphatase/pppGpp-phosphohydrolase
MQARLTKDTHLGAAVSPPTKNPSAADASTQQQQQGDLHASATAATLAALREYRAVLNKHDVLGTAAVATAAVRQATNSQQFVAAATAILGCPLQVLSGAL